MKEVTNELNEIVEELRSIIASVNKCYELVKVLYENQEREGLAPLEEYDNDVTTGTKEQEAEIVEEPLEEEIINVKPKVELNTTQEKKEIFKPRIGRPPKNAPLNCLTTRCKHNKNNSCNFKGVMVNCDERTE